MPALAATPVVIHTSPVDAPSVPDWFAEVTVLARHFAHRGLLDAIGQQVHLARGRAGHYDAIDFVALLLAYAVSGERTTSTSFMSGTGLKKCSPTKRAPRRVLAASSVMESEKVLEAKIVWGGQAASSAR